MLSPFLLPVVKNVPVSGKSANNTTRLRSARRYSVDIRFRSLISLQIPTKNQAASGFAADMIDLTGRLSNNSTSVGSNFLIAAATGSVEEMQRIGNILQKNMMQKCLW